MDEQLIEVIYRDGVFRPREAVTLEDGKKFGIIVKQFNIAKYYGAFGKASATGMRQLEEEVLI